MKCKPVDKYRLPAGGYICDEHETGCSTGGRKGVSSAGNPMGKTDAFHGVPYKISFLKTA
jgi:hypothetical protein